MKKPWYLRIWIWAILTLVIIAVPFVINEAYKCNCGYITQWTAADVLSFYGSLLSFMGTVALGIVAVEQTKTANQLSQRMLEIEKQQEIPIIDIIEIMDGQEPTGRNTLRNALQVTINESYYRFNEDNTINEASTDVIIFCLKNISHNHIISVIIEEVVSATRFNNEKLIPSDIRMISYNGGLRVFGEGDRQYISIGGIPIETPAISSEEAFEQGYTNPTIETDFHFILGNIHGQKYREIIRIRYVYLPSEDGINYPCMLEKEILNIEEIKTQ